MLILSAVLCRLNYPPIMNKYIKMMANPSFWRLVS